jgi:hypothetical protein
MQEIYCIKGVIFPIKIAFFNTCTNPQKLHDGDKFRITSTVENLLDTPTKIVNF